MKLISLVYDKGFNMLLYFPVLTEPYIQRPLDLYHLKRVPVPIQNKMQRQFPSPAAQKRLYGYDRGKLYFLDKSRIIFMQTHRTLIFCESNILVKHKTLQRCESAVFFDLSPDIFNANFEITSFRT